MEDAYVAGLKKLVRKPLQEAGSDMGYSCPARLVLITTDVQPAYSITLGRR